MSLYYLFEVTALHYIKLRVIFYDSKLVGIAALINKVDVTKNLTLT